MEKIQAQGTKLMNRRTQCHIRPKRDWQVHNKEPSRFYQVLKLVEHQRQITYQSGKEGLFRIWYEMTGYFSLQPKTVPLQPSVLLNTISSTGERRPPRPLPSWGRRAVGKVPSGQSRGHSQKRVNQKTPEGSLTNFKWALLWPDPQPTYQQKKWLKEIQVYKITCPTDLRTDTEQVKNGQRNAS